MEYAVLIILVVETASIVCVECGEQIEFHRNDDEVVCGFCGTEYERDHQLLPEGFWWGVAAGLTVGFFVFTTLGREMAIGAARAGEKQIRARMGL